MPIFGSRQSAKQPASPVEEEPLPEEELAEEPGVESSLEPVLEPTSGSVAEPAEEEEDNNFSDVLGLSAADEREIFGMGGADGEDEDDNDFSDVLEISPEDEAEIMGTTPKKKPAPVQRPQFRRTVTPYPSYPTMGGLNL